MACSVVACVLPVHASIVQIVPTDSVDPPQRARKPVDALRIGLANELAIDALVSGDDIDAGDHSEKLLVGGDSSGVDHVPVLSFRFVRAIEP